MTVIGTGGQTHRRKGISRGLELELKRCRRHKGLKGTVLDRVVGVVAMVTLLTVTMETSTNTVSVLIRVCMFQMHVSFLLIVPEQVWLGGRSGRILSWCQQ